MNLTENEKLQLCALLIKLVDIPTLHIDSTQSNSQVVQPQNNSIPEMLTIKQCVSKVNGLSEYTLRQMIIRNEIPYVRAGEGRNGKYLINKKDLLDYFNKQ